MLYPCVSVLRADVTSFCEKDFNNLIIYKGRGLISWTLTKVVMLQQHLFLSEYLPKHLKTMTMIFDIQNLGTIEEYQTGVDKVAIKGSGIKDLETFS